MGFGDFFKCLLHVSINKFSLNVCFKTKKEEKWNASASPGVTKLRKQEHEFNAKQGYKARSYLKDS